MAATTIGGGTALRDHVCRRRAYRYRCRLHGGRAAPVTPVGAPDRDPLRAADRDPAGAGRSAVPVPDAGQLHHRRTDAEHVHLGPRQFRGGAEGPPHRHHHDQLAGVRGGERGAGAAGRLGDGLDRRAHQHAVQAARLSHRDHLARHAVHPLRHGVAACSSARPARSIISTARSPATPTSSSTSIRWPAWCWSRASCGRRWRSSWSSATLRNANPELEEAARVHGAGVWQTIRRVTMRLSLPSIMALSMLVFIRAIEAFEVPALVGLPGRISVLTTDIYTNMVARAPPDIGGASALSVLMLLLVFVLLYIYGRLSRHAERFATITGKGFRPRPFDLGRLRYVAAGILDLQFRPAAAGAHADAGLGVAAAVLPAGQRRGVQARQPQQLPHGARFRPARADAQHHDGGGRDRDHRGGADLRRRLARGAARARRLDRRPARDHPAGVSRAHPRHRGDAALPRGADPDLRHARHPGLGLRHQLSALRHALLRRRACCRSIASSKRPPRSAAPRR